MLYLKYIILFVICNYSGSKRQRPNGDLTLCSMGRPDSHLCFIIRLSMANIISLNNRLQLDQEKKAALIKKRKISAVQKVFQCTRCAFKCEKCGTQISLSQPDQESVNRQVSVPYCFCESCLEEYIDYMERVKGRGDADCYWRNEAWLEVWKRWIDCQEAIDRYLKSKEFLQLLQEFKQTTPE